jgi:hypothetical protein
MRIDRHILAHAGLCVTYVSIFGLLVVDGQIVHAALTLAAAAFYAFLCHGASVHHSVPSHGTDEEPSRHQEQKIRQ